MGRNEEASEGPGWEDRRTHLTAGPVPVRWYGGPGERRRRRQTTGARKYFMTASLILVFAVLALMQFAVSQWRMIWLTTASQPLSDALHAATGIEAETIGCNDFGRLLGLCDELTPRLKRGTPYLSEVKGYYRLMARVEKACRSIQPALATWAASEIGRRSGRPTSG